ncbi:MAG: TRAP transporter small permease [Dehalococcoidia bacterium]|jgi:TRAP-type C4-dicarboxylate transport system permease small subunit
MLITGIDVIGRYLFHSPLVGAFEMSELALAIMVLFGWGYNQAIKGHVDIDIVYKRLPHGFQNILDLLTPLLGLALFIFISWQAINFMMDSIGWGETTEMLHMPVWIFKLTIFIGAVSISLQFLVDIITACQKLKGKA